MIVCAGLNPAIDRVLRVSGLVVGGHLKAECVALQAAGKAANVARVLDTLGSSAALVGFVGRESEAFFAESFAGGSVRIRQVALEEPTRINTTLVDPAAGTETHLREIGFRVPAEAFAALRQALFDVSSEGDLVLFAGSLPRGLDAGRVRELVDELRAAGRRVAADANGPLLEAFARAGTPLWCLKPNREELAAYAGRSFEGAAEIRAWMETNEFRRGPERFLVSDGAAGAGFFTAGSALWTAAPGVRAVNTVGAGDAFLAGFLHACESGMAPSGALAFAVAAGASAAEETVAGRVDPARIEALRAELAPFPVSGEM